LNPNESMDTDGDGKTNLEEFENGTNPKVHEHAPAVISIINGVLGDEDNWQVDTKLLRRPSAASRARSLLAYRSDMSRRSLRGSLHLTVLATFCIKLLETAAEASGPAGSERTD